MIELGDAWPQVGVVGRGIDRNAPLRRVEVEASEHGAHVLRFVRAGPFDGVGDEAKLEIGGFGASGHRGILAETGAEGGHERGRQPACGVR